MRFACEQCQAKYSIPDDRVENKLVRIKCQKCGAEIVVQGPIKAEAGTRTTVSDPPVMAEAGDPFSAFGDDDDEPRESTRISSLSELETIRRQALETAPPVATKPSGAKPSPPPAAPSPSDDAWFVLVAGEQRGPHPSADVKGMLQRGELHARSYLWREGMSQWTRAQDVAEFALAAKASPAPAKAPAESAPPAKRAAPVVRSLGTPLAEERSATAPGPDNAVSGAAHPSRDEVVEARGAPERDHAAPSRKSNDDEFSALFGPTGSEPVLDDSPPAMPLEGDDIAPGPVATVAEEPNELPVFATQPRDGLSDGPDAGADDGPDAFSSPPDEPAAPRESTRMFIAAAGIAQQKKRQRMYVAVAAAVALLVFFLIVLDFAGIIEIPGFGLAYDLLSIENPHTPAPASAPVTDLSDEERQRIVQGLMGNQAGGAATAAAEAAAAGGAPKPVVRPGPAGASTGASTGAKPTLAAEKDAAKPEGGLLADVYGDGQKTETKVNAEAARAPAQDLPSQLDAALVAKVVQQNLGAVKRCYDRELKRGNELSGRFDVEFTIQPSGAVSEALSRNEKLRDTELGSCVLSAVKTLRFPRFAGEALTVEYPFVFSSSQ